MNPPGRIIGGMGSPHAPSIATALNNGKTESAYWKPLFDGYQPMIRWVEAQKPDLIIIIANDHADSFFFDPLSEEELRAWEGGTEGDIL